MKMIYCTCNVSALESLLSLMEDTQISEYQVIEEVTAKNRTGNPRFNTHVWPGHNSAVLMQVIETEKVKTIIEKIKDYNHTAYNKNELITCCTWGLDSYIFDGSHS